MRQGRVVWFDEDKGFGFIAPDDGAEQVYVHYSEIVGSGYRTLAAGQRVEFDVGAGVKGPQAVHVLRL